jgi:hypothetical protein
MLPTMSNVTEEPVAAASEASNSTQESVVAAQPEVTPQVTEQNTEQVSAPQATETQATENTQEQAATENTQQTEEKPAEKKPLTFEDIQKRIRGEEPEPQKPVAKPNLPKQRDMTGIAPEHHKLFRNMSGEAFDLAKEKYIQAQSLQAELENLKKNPQIKPVQVFDHPEGFVLSEDYRAQNYRTTIATEINSHYQTQLAKAMRGEKWNAGDVDPKTGKFVVDKTELEPTPENIAQLTGFVTQTSMQALTEQQKLSQVGQQYQQGYQSDVGKIEAAIESYYKPLTDPKHPTAKLQEETIKLVPERFRNHPMTKLFVLTLAENARINGESKAIRAELATLKANKVDASKAQPTKSAFVNGGSGKAPMTFEQIQKMIADRS